MANITQPLCDLCKHRDICKFTEEYKEQFGEIKNLKHPLFEHKLICNRFADARPPQYDCCATTAISVRG